MVPVGSRSVVGCVVTPNAPQLDDTNIRDVSEVLDANAFLPPLIVDLALWVGDYYASGPGDALAVALLPGARSAQRTQFKKSRVVELTPVSTQVENSASPKPLGDRQRALLDLLSRNPAGVAV